MNIILETIVKKEEGWEVNENYACKYGEIYTACIQMKVGYFRAGIYHRGYAIWEQDHMGKDILELREVVKELNIEVVMANDNPRRYINGVIDDVEESRAL